MHFESHYYFTIIYLPPPDAKNRIASTFIEKSTTEGLDYFAVLTNFRHDVARIVQLMESNSVLRLRYVSAKRGAPYPSTFF